MIGLHDIGVDQIRDQAGFANEVLLELRYCIVFLADKLNRYGLTELARTMLISLENFTHAPLRDLANHFVGNFVGEMLWVTHGGD